MRLIADVIYVGDGMVPIDRCAGIRERLADLVFAPFKVRA